MKNRIWKGIVCLIVIIAFTGCAVRTYTQVRQREDQGVSGNAGYMTGTPPPVDQSDIRSTRKTYVLEIKTRGAQRQEDEIEAMLEETEAAVGELRGEFDAEQRKARRPREATKIEEAKPAFEDYKVQKNDTLQKISLKYYGTNHKWSKIAEANKNKIKDPNRIKPGIVLQIPLE